MKNVRQNEYARKSSQYVVKACLHRVKFTTFKDLRNNTEGSLSSLESAVSALKISPENSTIEASNQTFYCFSLWGKPSFMLRRKFVEIADPRVLVSPFAGLGSEPGNACASAAEHNRDQLISSKLHRRKFVLSGANIWNYKIQADQGDASKLDTCDGLNQSANATNKSDQKRRKVRKFCGNALFQIKHCAQYSFNASEIAEFQAVSEFLRTLDKAQLVLGCNLS
ncbi:hypothetical protein CLF_100303 [Clonorchis sinensis]|uniref:Uncharacterized protein n=1 Tax=Clonorchis sinensis TaxID=79923 RepID=G7Y354_CLOSI|nr:hypothetical protein CLF_100303 [Clonorchis sinensis]